MVRLITTFVCIFAALATSEIVFAKSQDQIRIGLVPFKVEGEQTYEKFLGKVTDAVNQAKTDKSELVVFPELLVADLVEAAEKKSPLTKQFQIVADDITPKYIEDLKKLAVSKKIAILGGTTPRRVGKDIFNTAILALPSGQVHLQDKVYLTPDEKDWGWKGGNKINLIEAPWGKTVITTCYDVEFPQITHELAPLNPELFLVPSMTDTVEGFKRVRWTAQARAVEHRAYVVHVGTTGNPDPSWPHWAQASFITPSEKGFPGILKESAENSSKILTADFDLKKLREARLKRGIHPAKDQNERHSISRSRDG